MTLYELTGAYVGLKDLLDDLDVTEDSTAIVDTMESIQADIEDKADAYAICIKTAMNEISVLKGVKERAEARIKTRDNLIKRLKENLMNALTECDLKKLKTLRFSYSMGNTESVEIDADVPDQYMRVKKEPDKTAIKAALKAGEQIDWAHLEKTPSLRIVG